MARTIAQQTRRITPSRLTRTERRIEQERARVPERPVQVQLPPEEVEGLTEEQIEIKRQQIARQQTQKLDQRIASKQAQQEKASREGRNKEAYNLGIEIEFLKQGKHFTTQGTYAYGDVLAWAKSKGRYRIARSELSIQQEQSQADFQAMMGEFQRQGLTRDQVIKGIQEGKIKPPPLYSASDVLKGFEEVKKTEEPEPKVFPVEDFGETREVATTEEQFYAKAGLKEFRKERFPELKVSEKPVTKQILPSTVMFEPEFFEPSKRGTAVQDIVEKMEEYEPEEKQLVPSAVVTEPEFFQLQKKPEPVKAEDIDTYIGLPKEFTEPISKRQLAKESPIPKSVQGFLETLGESVEGVISLGGTLEYKPDTTPYYQPVKIDATTGTAIFRPPKPEEMSLEKKREYDIFKAGIIPSLKIKQIESELFKKYQAKVTARELKVEEAQKQFEKEMKEEAQPIKTGYEKEIKGISKVYTGAVLVSALPYTFTKGVTFGALSVVAPPVATTFAGLGLAGLLVRPGRTREMIMDYPIRTGLHFGAGLIGVGVGRVSTRGVIYGVKGLGKIKIPEIKFPKTKLKKPRVRKIDISKKPTRIPEARRLALRRSKELARLEKGRLYRLEKAQGRILVDKIMRQVEKDTGIRRLALKRAKAGELAKQTAELRKLGLKRIKGITAKDVGPKIKLGDKITREWIKGQIRTQPRKTIPKARQLLLERMDATKLSKSLIKQRKLGLKRIKGITAKDISPKIKFVDDITTRWIKGQIRTQPRKTIPKARQLLLERMDILKLAKETTKLRKLRLKRIKGITAKDITKGPKLKLDPITAKWIKGQVEARVRMQPRKFIPKARQRALQILKPPKQIPKPKVMRITKLPKPSPIHLLALKRAMPKKPIKLKPLTMKQILKPPKEIPKEYPTIVGGRGAVSIYAGTGLYERTDVVSGIFLGQSQKQFQIQMQKQQKRQDLLMKSMIVTPKPLAKQPLFLFTKQAKAQKQIQILLQPQKQLQQQRQMQLQRLQSQQQFQRQMQIFQQSQLQQQIQGQRQRQRQLQKTILKPLIPVIVIPDVPKRIRRPKPSRIKTYELFGYAPSFTAKAVGLPEFRVTEEEGLKLVKKMLTGLEIRRPVRLIKKKKKSKKKKK